jgi:hypothetical protein
MTEKIPEYLGRERKMIARFSVGTLREKTGIGQKVRKKERDN